MKRHLCSEQLLCFLLFALTGTFAFGQAPASFAGARNYLGYSPAVADFNHDGILDLATVDGVTTFVHIHAGLGNGAFVGDEEVNVVTSSPYNYNYLLLTADLNGDGLADLIVGQSTSQSPIQVLLGTATGGFIKSGSYPTQPRLENFSLADVNLDGKLDLVVITSNTISVFLGNGNGTFQRGFTVFSGQVATTGLAIGDFNGDGKPDIAVPVSDNVFILLGDGTGKFPTGSSFVTSEAFGPIAAADLNSDGNEDLVLETLTKNFVEVLFGNGNGTFGPPQIYFTGHSSQDAAGLALGDVNGDGILDIVTPDPAVLIGNVDGTFGNPVLYPASSSMTSVQLVDSRGIGHLDIIGSVGVQGPGTPATTVLLNEGQGEFRDVAIVPVGLSTSSLCIAVADFNRDGNGDAAVGVQGGVEVLLGTGHAKGALTPATLLPLQSNRGFCPIAGDFNNDGANDLLVNEGNNTLELFAGNGDGTFAKPAATVISQVQPFQGLVVGDFNGDGKLDLAGFLYPNLLILGGNGAGNFTKLAAFSPPSEYQTLAAADLNGDGLTDLIVVSPNTLTVYLNTGEGIFSTQTYAMTQPTLYSSVVVDVNQDGIPDIVVICQSAVVTFLGQGGGVFAQASQLNAAGVNAVITDLNGDGFPDLALDDGTEIKVFLGNGTGAFTSPGNPDGLWFTIPNTGNVFTAAYLQSQSASSGFADLITLGLPPGNPPGTGELGILINQGVPQPAR